MISGAAMTTKHSNVTRTDTGTGSGTGGCQVVLYNDDHNAFDHVVTALMNVFGHPQRLALHITQEAHQKGKAIAEVEDEQSAMKHCLALRIYGLGADVEKI